jgi:hypothetical protein
MTVFFSFLNTHFMSTNKKDQNDVITTAKNDGYKWNSDESKLVKGNNAISFPTPGTVKVGDSTYNTSSGAKKSRNW